MTASAASAIHGQISSWPRCVAWTATARVGGSVSRSGGLSCEIESENRFTLNHERCTWPAITCSTVYRPVGSVSAKLAMVPVASVRGLPSGRITLTDVETGSVTLVEDSGAGKVWIGRVGGSI